MGFSGLRPIFAAFDSVHGSSSSDWKVVMELGPSEAGSPSGLLFLATEASFYNIMISK